jgi:hypothetical protein
MTNQSGRKPVKNSQSWLSSLAIIRCYLAGTDANIEDFRSGLRLNCTPSVRQKKRGQVDRHRLCQDGRRLYTGGAGEAEAGAAGEQPAEE